MSKKIIAVVGGTGMQGGGVVDALLERGRFAVRVLTRDPSSSAAKALAARGVEVVRGDLNEPATLIPALRGAHGAFVVTNFWDPGTGEKELAQGTAAVAAAREAGVSHFVWSTLPNSKAISQGKHPVPHFTGKALVDPVVTAAGFAHHTFVEAPMYFQNVTSMLGPQPNGDGTSSWTFPMDPTKRVIHAGDVRELGKLVARAFERPEEVGSGQHLAMAVEKVSWNDLIAGFEARGHRVSFRQVPREVFDGFFPGAAELSDMFGYFEAHTYYGPDAEQKIARARALVPESPTTFARWAEQNVPKATP